MGRISKAEYEKMTHEEQLKYWAENYETKTEQDITPAAEALSKAFEDEEFVKETSKLLDRFCDGEPVNKNPLIEIPNPEMRLYHIDNNYFESIDELLHYCRINNKSTKELKILDYYREFAGCNELKILGYYREFAGCNDVIRNQDCDTIMFYTVVDADGYGMYNNERSIYRGKFTWEYNYGSIREMYKPFRDKGIVFENDIYAKHDEAIKKEIEEIAFNLISDYNIIFELVLRLLNNNNQEYILKKFNDVRSGFGVWFTKDDKYPLPETVEGEIWLIGKKNVIDDIDNSKRYDESEFGDLVTKIINDGNSVVIFRNPFFERLNYLPDDCSYLPYSNNSDISIHEFKVKGEAYGFHCYTYDDELGNVIKKLAKYIDTYGGNVDNISIDTLISRIEELNIEKLNNDQKVLVKTENHG